MTDMRCNKHGVALEWHDKRDVLYCPECSDPPSANGVLTARL